jgi:hypothetical protein
MLVEVEDQQHWDQILGTVSQDHVPIHCVKKVVFKLRGGKQKTINLDKLRKEGLDLEELETVLTNKMINMNKDIVNMDFVIDVEAVKETIQPLTEEYLGKL